MSRQMNTTCGEYTHLYTPMWNNGERAQRHKNIRTGWRVWLYGLEGS
jgi:hypothetical protein